MKNKLLARDVMSRKVVTLNPDMTVREAADLLAKNKITGAPVVDSKHRLLGVISQTDLVRRIPEPEHQKVPAFYHDGERVVLANPVDSADDVAIARIMTPAVLSAEEETPVEQLAAAMLRKRIHRVMIVHDAKLRGIVTSMDLLKLLTPRASSRRR